VFGWALRAGGFVSVDRRDRSRVKESFGKAVKHLRRGRSTVIFPEGTRSLDGRLLSFERGGFLLAIKSGAAIVPAGIRGTLAVRRRGGWKVTPGRIRVEYGGPLETSRYTIRSRSNLVDAVRQEILSLAEMPEG